MPTEQSDVTTTAEQRSKLASLPAAPCPQAIPMPPPLLSPASGQPLAASQGSIAHRAPRRRHPLSPARWPAPSQPARAPCPQGAPMSPLLLSPACWPASSRPDRAHRPTGQPDAATVAEPSMLASLLAARQGAGQQPRPARAPMPTFSHPYLSASAIPLLTSLPTLSAAIGSASSKAGQGRQRCLTSRREVQRPGLTWPDLGPQTSRPWP